MTMKRPRSFPVNPDSAEEKSHSIEKPKAKIAEESQLIFEEDFFEDATYLEEGPKSPLIKDNKYSLLKYFSILMALMFSLILGLSIEQIIQDFYLRSEWLGHISFVIFILSGVFFLILMLREWFALRKLNNLSGFRERLNSGAVKSLQDAHKISDEISYIYRNRDDVKDALKKIKDHKADIMDSEDYLLILERELMHPLDQQSEALLIAAAKRVSIVTAVNPRALIDMIFIGYESFKLLRAMSVVYGGKSHSFAMIKLYRLAFANLAISGGIALTDGLASQLFGHSLASKISTKFGEGVLNGMLIIRFGIAAQSILRPMPFIEAPAPKAVSIISKIWKASN